MQDYDEAADWESLRALSGPGLVDTLLREGIKLCWPAMPPERRNVGDVAAQVRRLVGSAIEAMDADLRAFLDWEGALAEASPGGVTASGPARHLSGTVFDLRFSGRLLREALKMCWLMVPPDGRDTRKVQGMFQRLVERALRDMGEDAAMFGMS